jgi:SAM-dependent methyltransferase
MRSSGAVDLKLSPHVLFFGGRHRVHLYHDLNGSVIPVRGAVLEALLPVVPALATWDGEGPETRAPTSWGVYEPLDRAQERLFRWHVLVPEGLDEETDLLDWFPVRSVWSVFYVREDHAVLRVRHDRAAGTVLEQLQGLEAALWLACDGTRSFRTMLEAAGGEVARVRALARAWTRWDSQLLKWLPRPLPEIAAGGLPVEFLSHLKDQPSLSFARGDERAAGLPPPPSRTPLSHLFRIPHPALHGRSYGGAVGAALRARGALGRIGARLAEVGAGSGALAFGLLEMIEREMPAVAAGLTYTIIESSPASANAQRAVLAGIPGHVKEHVRWVDGSPERLPIPDGSVDLLVADELLGELAVRRDPVTSEIEHVGAHGFLDEIARVLAPRGAAILTTCAEPVPQQPDQADQTEPERPTPAPRVRADRGSVQGVRCDRLVEHARLRGLDASAEPLVEMLGFDRQTPLLFADQVHMEELFTLARAAGRNLPVLAYTREMLAEALSGALDIDRLANLSFATIGPLAPLGACPHLFQAIVVRAPEEGP